MFCNKVLLLFYCEIGLIVKIVARLEYFSMKYKTFVMTDLLVKFSRLREHDCLQLFDTIILKIYLKSLFKIFQYGLWCNPLR